MPCQHVGPSGTERDKVPFRELTLFMQHKTSQTNTAIGKYWKLLFFYCYHSSSFVVVRFSCKAGMKIFQRPLLQPSYFSVTAVIHYVACGLVDMGRVTSYVSVLHVYCDVHCPLYSI